MGDLSFPIGGIPEADKAEPAITFAGGTVEVGVPNEASTGFVGVVALTGDPNEFGNGKLGAEFRVGVKAANNGRIICAAVGDCKDGVGAN